MVTVNIELKQAFEVLCEAAKDASKALLEIVENGFEKSFKANDDPVTTGDLTVNTILQEKLFEAFPEIGWLSEETRDNPILSGLLILLMELKNLLRAFLNMQYQLL
ncbi:MAG: hypothetical protein ACTSPF_03465 [Candidatus Heimdallarchaeaceae archaeon]